MNDRGCARRSAPTLGVAVAIAILVGGFPTAAGAHGLPPNTFVKSRYPNLVIADASDGSRVGILPGGGGEGPPQVEVGARRREVFLSHLTTACSATVSRVAANGKIRPVTELYGGGYSPAVTQDGRLIAFAPPVCPRPWKVTVAVRDLRSNQEHRWTLPDERYELTNAPVGISALSWAPDSRHLAITVEFGDRRDWGASKRSEVWIARFGQNGLRVARRLAAPYGATWSEGSYRGRWGTLAVVEKRRGVPERGRPDTYRVISLDPTTGEVLSPLAWIPTASGVSQLDFDAEGRRMLVTTDYYEGRLWRWAGGALVAVGRGSSAAW